MDIADIVGVTEAARAIGVHKSTISRQIAAGKIPNRGTASAPKVSITEARQARADNIDPAQQRAAPTTGSANAHRADYEEARARMAQLDLAEKLGLVVPRADIEDAIATATRELREALARRWRVLALELQGMTAREIETKGMASDEAVLAELAVKLDADADEAAAVAA